MSPLLQGFDVLIGTWTTEATHRLIDDVVSGTSRWEWLDGGHFVLQRTHYDHERLPDALSVIGAPETGDGLVLEYFDTRGTRRTYALSLEGGVLRYWRDHPGFDQRFSATLHADAFEGVSQLAETPGKWLDDLTVRYRRSDA
jgi:hypothetical protein